MQARTCVLIVLLVLASAQKKSAPKGLKIA